MNTGVGSLSLLQGIFLIQESNRARQTDSFSPCLVFRNSTLIYLGELYYHSLPLSGHFQTRFLCPSVVGSFPELFLWLFPPFPFIFLKPLTQVLSFFFCFLSNFPSVCLLSGEFSILSSNLSVMFYTLLAYFKFLGSLFLVLLKNNILLLFHWYHWSCQLSEDDSFKKNFLFWNNFRFTEKLPK